MTDAQSLMETASLGALLRWTLMENMCLVTGSIALIHLVLEYPPQALQSIHHLRMRMEIAVSKIFALCAIFFQMILVCGVPNRAVNDKRIVGGIPSEVAEFPWQVSQCKS